MTSFRIIFLIEYFNLEGIYSRWFVYNNIQNQSKPLLTFYRFHIACGFQHLVGDYPFFSYILIMIVRTVFHSGVLVYLKRKKL